MQAIEEGDQFKTRAAPEFFLRAAETLRRLEGAVLTERRQAGEQVPKSVVEQTATQISQWLRAAFQEFLSFESRALMGIKDHGVFRAYAIERFRGILHRTVMTALKTNPPIPVLGPN
jgi:hypothetical protein